MLLQFKVKNFKSFYDENVLDFVATQEKRHIETTFEKNGYHVLPILAIHGANASGKTSILEALNDMFYFIRNSYKMDVNELFPTKPYAFSKKTLKENSEFEISLCINDYEYRYGFSINEESIEEEWLYQKKFSFKTKASQKIVFERFHDEVTFGSFFQKYQKIWELFKNVNEKKLFILSSIALKEEDGIFRNIYDYISNCSVKIERYFNRKKSINILNQNGVLYQKFRKILNEFDPSLNGIEIKKQEDENNKNYYLIYGKHQNIDNEDSTVLIPLEQESEGTIKIFNILPNILYNLENGGVMCIDELDVQLHPLLFRKIVLMYQDKKINKKNSQLIFTTHSTFLLNSETLRRDEIYLVEKNKQGKSNLYSLSEFKNLRVDADYEKKYLTGQFGAIPFQDK